MSPLLKTIHSSNSKHRCISFNSFKLLLSSVQCMFECYVTITVFVLVQKVLTGMFKTVNRSD